MSVTQARRLRRQMTPPEIRLWNALRSRPDGFKFRRQHPVAPFVIDFFCTEAALAIEIDGMAHEMGDNPDRDERRDLWLLEQGIMTLRFRAPEIRDNLNGVVTMIVQCCLARSGQLIEPLRQPSAATSPAKAGEEISGCEAPPA